MPFFKCWQRWSFILILPLCFLALCGTARGQDAEQADWAALVMAMENDPSSKITLDLNRRFLQRHARSAFRPAAECMQAYIFFMRRQFSSALQIYSRLLAEPAAAAFQDLLLFRQGESHANLGNPNQAESSWQALSRQHPRDYLIPEIKLVQAGLNLKQAKYTAAAEAYQQLLSQYPRYAGRRQVSEGLAWIDVASQKFPEAIARLEGIHAPDAVYLKGLANFYLKKYPQAVSDFYEFSRFPGLHPDQASALFLKGESAWQMQDPALAAECFAFLSEQYPDHPLTPYARYKLTALYLFQGKWVDAWSQAGALPLSGLPNIEAFQVQYLKAEILARLGRYAEAAEYLRQVLAEPGAQTLKSGALLKYAWLLYHAQQYSSSLESANQYLQAFAAGTHAPWACFLASASQYQLGWLDQSAQNAAVVLERFPASMVQPLAVLCLQSLRLKSQSPDLVISQTAAIQTAGDPVQNQKYEVRALNLLLLGWAYEQKQRFREAVRLYETICMHYKGTQAAPWAQALLLQAGFASGQYAKTLAQARAISTDLNWDEWLRQESLLVQGHCLLKLKHYEQALAAYQAWLQTDKTGPEKPAVYFLQGLACFGLQAYSQAQQKWDQAAAGAQRDGSSRRVLLSIADAYFNSGDYARGRVYYQLFLQRHGQDPAADIVHLRLAQAFYKEGKDLEAMKTFQTYLRISSGRGTLPAVPTPAAIKTQLEHPQSTDDFVFPSRNRFGQQAAGFREVAIREMDQFFMAGLTDSVVLARQLLPTQALHAYASPGRSSASPLPASPWLTLLTQEPVLSIRTQKMPVFTAWKFSVLDAAGNTLNMQSGQGRLPDPLVWDGRNPDGRRLAVGSLFQYGIALLPTAGKPLMTFSAPVRLDTLAYADPQRVHVVLSAEKLFAPDQPAVLSVSGRAYMRAACDVLRQKGWQDIQVRVNSSRGADREAQAEAIGAFISEELDLLPGMVTQESRPVDRSAPVPGVEISSRVF